MRERSIGDCRRLDAIRAHGGARERTATRPRDVPASECGWNRPRARAFPGSGGEAHFSAGARQGPPRGPLALGRALRGPSAVQRGPRGPSAVRCEPSGPSAVRRGPRGPPAVQRVWRACEWFSSSTGRRDQAVVAGPTGSSHRLVSDGVARTLCRSGRARDEATAWLCAGRSLWVTSFWLSGPLWAGQAEGHCAHWLAVRQLVRFCGRKRRASSICARAPACSVA